MDYNDKKVIAEHVEKLNAKRMNLIDAIITGEYPTPSEKYTDIALYWRLAGKEEAFIEMLVFGQFSPQHD